eukprot:288295-Rhodomonas_salina.2
MAVLTIVFGPPVLEIAFGAISFSAFATFKGHSSHHKSAGALWGPVGSGFQAFRSRVWGLGSRVQGPGFSFQCPVSRV